MTAALALHEKDFIYCSPRLDAERILQITNEWCNSEKVQVSTISIKSQTDKILYYGLRQLLQEISL